MQDIEQGSEKSESKPHCKNLLSKVPAAFGIDCQTTRAKVERPTVTKTRQKVGLGQAAHFCNVNLKNRLSTLHV